MINSLYEPFKKWSEKGTIWLYSDTHFGETFKNHPNWLNDEEQISSINKCVGKYDTLVILGDIGNIEKVKQLHGYKVMLKGNHDIGYTKYQTTFDEVYNGPLFISKKILLSHEPINCPYAFNIHGHDHENPDYGNYSLNVCSNIIDFKPINLNKLIKLGKFHNIPDIHESVIKKRN